MRRTHIDYLRSMVEGLVQGEDFVIPSDRFFEYQPPLDSIQEKIPCAILKASEPTNSIARKVKRRLAKIVRGRDTFLKNAVRQIKQEFKYTVDFWLETPDADVVSTVTERGILDQCLLFVAEHRWIQTDEGIPIEVRFGKNGIITDPAKETGNYKLYVEIIFRDGLYTIEEEETLGGAELEESVPTLERV
ncbi:LIC10173 family protein [Leptospira licerasiae]|uniref:LIC10173 family protein n=1 Tax=Leptospira licerasiae TaxID=447106 RepID=UPI0010829B09|nr:hypothetical protein [Leptospira licerasiae]TGM88497.1 hypothetical protein EHR05_13535 [Leptospira licerasiae]